MALLTNGTGEMVANGKGGRLWSWKACNEDEKDCAAFASGEEVATGSAPAGTIFLATNASTNATARSPIWRGSAEIATPPGISGEVKANSLVTPVPARWRGGWAGDFDRTQLAACMNPDGSNCTTLTSYEYRFGCPNGAAIIDPVFTGRYLRVADEVYGPNTAFAEVGLNSPYGDQIWPPDATTSVAVVGKIEPAAGPREGGCGPLPLVEAPQPRPALAAKAG